jgi:mRNA interferase MazF
MIKQGDIYWLQLADDDISRIRHPHVIIQANALNHDQIETVVVCALTSNIKRVSVNGNVLLDAGEGNLPKQSVVEVSKVATIATTQLGEYIGSLDEQRVKQILAGMRLVQLSFFAR